MSYTYVMDPDAIAARQSKNKEQAAEKLAAERHQQSLDKIDALANSNLDIMRAFVRYLNKRTSKTQVTNQLKSIATPDALKVVAIIKTLDKTVKDKKIDWKPMQEALKPVAEALQQQANKKDPDPLDLSPLKIDYEQIANAFSGAIEKLAAPIVNVAAPIIKVPKADAPIINTQKVDMKPFVNEVLQVLTDFRVWTQDQIEEDPVVWSELREMIEKQNDLLTKIEKKKFGGGGGGGGGGGPVFKESALLGRASPLVYPELTADGKVSVEAALAAGSAVEIANDVGNPIPVNGTVALDSATLTALETINVILQTGGIVGLDATTLTALENIVVSGTVALDTTTLAALENINAVVTGTVALDAASLAALETINAVVTGTVTEANSAAILSNQTDGDQKGQIWDPQSSRRARVTLLEELAVGERQIRFADSFANGIDAVEWTTVPTGSATATATEGVARLATGVTANSTISFTGAQTPVFFPGTVTLFQSGVTIPDVGTANNTRRWGAFDANNGYFFELSGTTLRVVSRSNVTGSVVDTVTAISGFTLDANNHTYEIQWQGNAALFLVDRTTVANLSGQTTTARTNTLDFPVRYENNNSGGLTTNLQLNIRGVSISSRGTQDLQTGRWGYNSGTGGSTVTLSSGKRVLQITAVAVGNAASLTINGGDTITLPYDSADKASSTITIEPKGNLVDPVIVFTGTDAYFIEWVS